MKPWRRAVLLSPVLVFAAACIAWAAAPGRDTISPPTAIDPLVTTLLKAVGETYLRLSSCQDTIEVVVTNRFTSGKERRSETLKSSLEFALSRPNKMALRLRSDTANFQIVSDGTTLWRYIQERGGFMKTLAPASLDVLLLQPGLAQGLALQAFSSKPYEILMKDVIGARLLDQESDGQQALDHVRLYQRNAVVDMWVGAEDRLIRRMRTAIDDQAKGASILIEETHQPVASAAVLPSALFRFEPPPGAIEVKSFGADMLLNKLLPALSVRDAQGQSIDLRAAAGRPLVLTFWQSGVPASVDVFKAIDALSVEPGRSASFLAVGLKESADAIRAGPRAPGSTMRMAADPAGELAMRLGVDATPAVFVADANCLVTAVFPTGRVAPELDLRDLQRRPLRLSDAGPSPLVLIFWRADATNAGELLTALDGLAAEFNGQAVFAAVNVQEPRATVAAFAQAHGLKLRMGLDPDGKAAALLGITATNLPLVLIIDPWGRLCANHKLGADTPQKLADQLRLEITVISRIISALRTP